MTFVLSDPIETAGIRQPPTNSSIFEEYDRGTYTQNVGVGSRVGLEKALGSSLPNDSLFSTRCVRVFITDS